MKAIKTIVMILSLSVVYQFAMAQSPQPCNNNKVRMVKGGYHCGCHCQKKCVAPGDVQAYLNNGWWVGDGCFGSCCYIRAGEDFSIETTLEEIYPNPASESISIAFTLAEPGEVVLEVFDMTGRKAATITRTVYEEASNIVTWNITDLSPGMYFIKMSMGSFSATKRLSIL